MFVDQVEKGRNVGFIVAIWTIVLTSQVLWAEPEAPRTTRAVEQDLIIVPNRDMDYTFDREVGHVKVEISSDNDYRTYRVTFDSSTYVTYADLDSHEKHLVFDTFQRRFRTLTDSVIVYLRDDASFDDILDEYDIKSGRLYPALGFANFRLDQDNHPASLVDRLKSDPRVSDAQVTFEDQFRRRLDSINLTTRSGLGADRVVQGKDSLVSVFVVSSRLDFSALEPTFNVELYNLGAAQTPLSTLRSNLVRIVPDDTTDDADDSTFSIQPIGEIEVLPNDPKGEPFETSVTVPIESLEADRTYFVFFDVFEGTEVDPEADALAQGTSGFTLDYLKRIRHTCVASGQSLLAEDTDPLQAHQWHLANTGQSAFAQVGGVADEDLGMLETLSDGPTGDGVKVAVVDTGMEVCHPDLWANVEQGASFNFNMPEPESEAASSWRIRQESSDPFSFDASHGHGTAVAGLIAATANNAIGGRGVAPGARLRGYNLLYAADMLNASIASLGASDFQPNSTDVDIFNMSFGAFVARPQKLASFEEQILLNGVRKLRSGNGAIYVKAAGNGFEECNSLSRAINLEIGCISSNLDAAHSLPYGIVVGAHNASGEKAGYSSAGANIWVSAPGGGFGIFTPALVTVDSMGPDRGFAVLFKPTGSAPPLEDDDELNPYGDYTSLMNGTSGATPNAAGAVAVILEANPAFTWRDIKHILANTARNIDPDIEAVELTIDASSRVVQLPWTTNAAGYSFHNWYGFGAVALDDALGFAAEHEPDSLGEFYESAWFEFSETIDIPDNDIAGVSQTLNVQGLIADANIEAVVVEIDWQHDFPNDLGVHLISPEGTRSVVSQVFDETLAVREMETFTWRVLTNAFYGENPNGEWQLEIFDGDADDVGQLFTWRLRFYYGEHP